MSSELIGRCGGQRPGHHASILGSSSALCHIGVSSHRCDWSFFPSLPFPKAMGDGRSGSSVALRCKPTNGDGVGDGWSGDIGNGSGGASGAGTGDGCCSSESSGIVYAWHAAASSIPQQAQRAREPRAAGGKNPNLANPGSHGTAFLAWSSTAGTALQDEPCRAFGAADSSVANSHCTSQACASWTPFACSEVFLHQWFML